MNLTVKVIRKTKLINLELNELINERTLEIKPIRHLGTFLELYNFLFLGTVKIMFSSQVSSRLNFCRAEKY